MTFSASHLFVASLLVVNLMGSVRYIFRFGEPGTSPTYSMPPAEYFLFWNLIIGFMALIAITKMRKISIDAAVAYSLLLVIALVCLLQAESFHVRGAARSMVLYGFFFLCIYSNRYWLSARHVNRGLEMLAVLGLGFLAYQYVQYVWYGVLPAHSHEGQLIRYGSFYDDSLVLGTLLPMFAGYFFHKFPSPRALLLTSTLACFVAVLTGSMTAMVVTAVYVAWNLRRHWYMLASFLILVTLSYFYLLEHLIDLWWFKTDSIEGHFEGWRKLEDVGVLALSGFFPLDTFAESGFLLLLYNFGLPVLVIVVALHLATLRACHLIFRRRGEYSDTMRALAGATEGLTVSALLASMNLPIVIVSPVYLLVAILSAVVLQRVARPTWRPIFVATQGAAA